MRTLCVVESLAEGGACLSWQEARGGRFEHLFSPDLLALRAVYAPYEVVQPFVRVLLRERPAWVEFEALSSVTADLARLAHALGFGVALRLPERGRLPAAEDVLAWRWLRGLLEVVAVLRPAVEPADEKALRDLWPECPATVEAPAAAEEVALQSARAGSQGAESADAETAGFGYEAYAFGERDQNLLLAMQEPYTAHFSGCERVLDLGCGTGVFVELLTRQGVAATGVERNVMSARYASSLGLAVVEEDALAYLASQHEQWDGVYCSHFVEHLPVEAVQLLLQRVARALVPGGVAVFAFPDPESIRSQLLGFWRDPEHVRFYHPELITVMARSYGLELEFDSQQVPGRRVVPFELEPPLPQTAPLPQSWRRRWLARLGLASRADLAAQQARCDALEVAVRRLWEVNQTWAWDDNAVLRFRKESA